MNASGSDGQRIPAVRRETSHTHKHTTRTTQHTTWQEKLCEFKWAWSAARSPVNQKGGVNQRCECKTGWDRTWSRMRLIAGGQATRKPARANPHTLGSAPSACVRVCSLYINRLWMRNYVNASGSDGQLVALWTKKGGVNQRCECPLRPLALPSVPLTPAR